MHNFIREVKRVYRLFFVNLIELNYNLVYYANNFRIFE